MLPTVATILGLDAVRSGQPRVVACADRLDAPVRWVHAIELADAARLLRGGELVLTTGIALPEDPLLLDAYLAGLARVGVSAVAVELGRRYTGGLPAGFVQAAEDHGVPLIVFEREVPFIAITEAVHAMIIDDQLAELRASARLHEVFTDLAVAGAGPGEILGQAALLAGRPVILEDLSHHVLACEPAAADPARLLDGFEARSRAVALPPARTAYDRALGLADHHGGGARRGLGPAHPRLRRPAGRHRHRAGPLAGAWGTLRADALSVFMVIAIGAISLMSSWVGIRTMARECVEEQGTLQRSSLYGVLVQAFVAFMLLAVLAANVGVLWVAIEATTIVTVFLVGHRRTRGSLEAAWKYIVICSVGIALAFLGTVFVYGGTARRRTLGPFARLDFADGARATTSTLRSCVPPSAYSSSATAPRSVSPRCTAGSPMPTARPLPRCRRSCREYSSPWRSTPSCA